jgi:hypothetical protein
VLSIKTAILCNDRDEIGFIMTALYHEKTKNPEGLFVAYQRRSTDKEALIPYYGSQAIKSNASALTNPSNRVDCSLNESGTGRAELGQCQKCR